MAGHRSEAEGRPVPPPAAALSGNRGVPALRDAGTGHAEARRGNQVRPFRAEDATEVARLFQRILWRRRGPAPASLAPYLVEIFSRHPWSDPRLTSHVYASTDGVIRGFLGALPVRMSHRGRPLLAAVASSIMVDTPEQDPLAGARLVRAFFQGPQELSISETASEVTRRMWLPLGGRPMPAYSLDWVRVLRPASFLAQVASLRAPLLRHLTPPVSVFDPLLAPLLRGAVRVAAPDGVTGADVTPDDFASIVPDALADLALRPDFDAAALRWLVSHAVRKERHGSPVVRIVRDRRDAAVGGYLAHLRPRGLMRIAEIFASPARAGAVVDEMLAHAWRLGAAAVIGRNRPEAPALMDALELRRSVFLRLNFTLVQSRSPELVDAVASGNACLTGLAGETWARIIGGEFA
jgi:hypothetical protein